MCCRKSLFLIVFIFFSSILRGQDIILFEDFENASGRQAPSNWTQQIIQGDANVDSFQFFDTFYHFSPGIDHTYALFDSYTAGNASLPGTFLNGSGEKVVLVSPSINTSTEPNLYLSFNYYLRAYRTKFLFQVSSNGGTNWSTVFRDSISSSLTKNIEIDLSSYKSSGFKMRFVWDNPFSSNSYGYLALDNIQLASKYNRDLSIETRFEEHILCSQDSVSFPFKISNVGLSLVTGFSAVLNLSGAKDTSYNITGNAIGPSIERTESFGLISIDSAGLLQFELIVSAGSDQNRLNDTFRGSVMIYAKPNPPFAQTAYRCGYGAVEFNAQGNGSDSIIWFSDSINNEIINKGNYFQTPAISGHRSFWLEQAKQIPSKISTFQGPWRMSGSITGGCFINVEAKQDIVLDSISQLFAYSQDSNLVSIYWKQGTYQGSESNASDWELWDQTYTSSKGFGKYTSIDIRDFSLFQGDVVALYITISGGNSPTFKNDSLSFENPQLKIYGNKVNNALFSGTLFSGYFWDGILHYRSQCRSDRSEVKAVVTPKPSGLNLNKGVLYNGVYRSGTQSDPDILFSGQQSSYEIPSPNGLNWNDYGTKWVISKLIIETSNGGLLTPKDTQFIIGSGSAPATLFYSAPALWGDSIIIIDLEVTNLVNGCDTSFQRYLQIAHRPVFSFSADNFCEGEKVEFTNNSSVRSASLSYLWYFGDGDSSKLKQPEHLYDSFGVYNVTLRLKSSLGYTVDTVFSIEVIERPQAAFTARNSCLGTPIQFNNQSFLSKGSLNYFWEFGDNNSSGLRSPNHQYSQVGTFIVSLTAINGNCTNTITKNVQQFPIPEAAFDHDRSCANNLTQFYNRSTISSGSGLEARWRVNNTGSYIIQQNPKLLLPLDSGNKIELVVISQFQCTDTLKADIDVLPEPEINIEILNTCDKTPTKFINNSSSENSHALTYLWKFGDGTNSVLKSPTHQYSSTGSYAISLEVADSLGCKAEYTNQIFISSQPLANFSILDSCSRSAIQFQNLTSNTIGTVNFLWDFGDGDSSENPVPQHLYEDSLGGSYEVTLFASGSGNCSSSYSKTVNIYEKPICEFSFSKNGTAVQFDGPSIGVPSQYLWTLDDGVTTNVEDPFYDYLELKTPKEVSLYIITEDGCDCEFTKSVPPTIGIDSLIGTEISIYPNPVKTLLHITWSASLDLLESIELINTEGKTVYSISDISDSQNVEINLENFASGVYYLEFRMENNTLRKKIILL